MGKTRKKIIENIQILVDAVTKKKLWKKEEDLNVTQFVRDF